MNKSIEKIKALHNYMLEVKLGTGDKKLFDFKPYLQEEVFFTFFRCKRI